MNTGLPKRTILNFLLSLTIPMSVLSGAAFAQNMVSVHPGTLNYVEGQVSTEGRELKPQAVGQTTLEAGQYLATANGKAEVLLTPGVFLRLGNDTTVKMISPDLTHTEIQLERGRATVEADQIYKQNRILINQPGGQTQILKNGLYEFDAANSTVRVFDGKAAVYPGSDYNADIKPIGIGGGRQLTLTGDAVKPQKFDKDKAQAGDSLYARSDLRSQYLGQANLELADQYAYGGVSGFAPGWAWYPGLYGYTWLPGDGLFYSPFGYGFYSPYYIYGGGFVYGRGVNWRSGHPIYPAHGGGYHGGTSTAFRGGSPGVSHGGGGFSGGGGGGFHGGGGGGHR